VGREPSHRQISADEINRHKLTGSWEHETHGYPAGEKPTPDRVGECIPAGAGRPISEERADEGAKRMGEKREEEMLTSEATK
jgi:hypothetical protein